jgi:hypothetical protein
VAAIVVILIVFPPLFVGFERKTKRLLLRHATAPMPRFRRPTLCHRRPQAKDGHGIMTGKIWDSFSHKVVAKLLGETTTDKWTV